MTLPNTIDYYGEEAKHGVDKNFEKLVMNSLEAWSELSFLAYEYVIVVHAGPDQAETGRDSDIWSRCYNFNGHAEKLTGAGFGAASGYVWGVSVVSEDSEMGIFAHEFAHALGLPDLYNYEDHSSFVGGWSLMDHGDWLGTPEGSSPSYLEAWSQIHLGWVTYEQWAPNQTASSRKINPLESSGGVHAIKVPISRFTYYLVEVRKQMGFDKSLPAEGVLISFVDDTMNSGEGIVRVIDSHPDTETLNDAIFTVGEFFADSQNKVYVMVEAGDGDGGYNVYFSNTVITRSTVVTEISPVESYTSSSTAYSQPMETKNMTQSLLITVVSLIVITIVGIATYTSRRKCHEGKRFIERSRSIEPTRVYCVHCGASIPSGSAYCSSCGTHQ